MEEILRFVTNLWIIFFLVPATNHLLHPNNTQDKPTTTTVCERYTHPQNITFSNPGR